MEPVRSYQDMETSLSLFLYPLIWKPLKYNYDLMTLTINDTACMIESATLFSCLTHQSNDTVGMNDTTLMDIFVTCSMEVLCFSVVLWRNL
uniref:AlNc14C68G4775 protein n=1 Tax=Albugo laibachii Nc14 TaxID=890382 RepID=F0WDQ4_9STRA|nr:AlNc14C68G4775 [Albugo laibachii Nc14]|eukprot:CCA19331.1 AlNc14C68G4775 [Albugo laibachii Nc14]